jgi:hypothetical protein
MSPSTRSPADWTSSALAALLEDLLKTFEDDGGWCLGATRPELTRSGFLVAPDQASPLVA